MNSFVTKYKVLSIPFLALYTWLIIQIAWVSDDAMITFRSMEFFVHGYGPIFNIGERVQTFTHPLWFLVQSALNFAFNLWKYNPLGQAQMYFLNILLCLAFSFLAVSILVFSVASSTKSAILTLLIFSLSKAYLDYSTSGLENPLTHLILIIFISVYLKKEEVSGQDILLLAVLAGLAGLNRLDSISFYLPVLINLFFQSKNKWKTLQTTMLGFLPLIVWEVFSVFYYGMPFPNTAYAKIGNAILISSLIEQGGFYYLNSLKLDPITLLVIVISLIMVFIHQNQQHRMVMMGVLMYLFYILYIGGDFMSGRFLTAPLIASTAILSKLNFKSLPIYGLVLTFVLIIGIYPTYLVAERHPTYGKNGENFLVFLDPYGIADERNVYPKFSLRYTLENKQAPVSGYARDKWKFDPRFPLKVIIVSQLGFPAYRLGPNIHVIDRNSLSDAFMPRLPLYDSDNWRVGHYHHIIPKGYLETLKTGENRIVDKDLALYYDKLSLVIHGDLTHWARLREIWYLNTGKYDYLLKNAAESAEAEE